MLSMLSTTSSVDCSRSARSILLHRLCEIARGGKILLHELLAEGVEHRPLIAVRLDGDKRRTPHLMRPHHPARANSGRQCRLPLAALPAHHGVAFVRAAVAGARATPGCAR